MKTLKSNVILLTSTVALSLSACGQTAATGQSQDLTTATVTQTTTQTTQAGSQAPTQTTAAKTENTVTDNSLTGPYLVTSCGQSPGAVMVNMVAVQAGLTSTNDNALSTGTFVAGDNRTLIVTTGTSMKGMGAAGTDVNAEIKRCTALIQAAKDAGLTVVGAHVEGMARRTDSSDAASIEAIMELADVILVIEESDSDGYFTQYAADHQKTLLKVADSLSISTVLQ